MSEREPHAQRVKLRRLLDRILHGRILGTEEALQILRRHPLGIQRSLGHCAQVSNPPPRKEHTVRLEETVPSNQTHKGMDSASFYLPD